ncbi:MAG: Tsi3 family protein [Pseudomonadota bacterium]
MAIRLMVAAVLALGLTGCEEEEAGMSLSFVRDIQMEGGVTVPLPEGYEAVEVPGAVRLTEAGGARSQTSITVDWADAAPVGGDATALADTGFQHTVTRLEAIGSGGQEWKLLAWKQSGSRWLIVDAQEQAEDGEPDFAVPIAVLKALTVD